VSGWTDAHCHLQGHFLDRTEDDVPDKVASTLERASAAGVERVIVVGTDAASSEEALAIAEGPSPVELFATVGLHPHDAVEDLAPVAALARKGHPRLVAIGECGLDYYYEHSPRSRQREAFAAQVGLAHELDLALMIHARDAFDDLTDVLRSEGVPARTVIHCFTGTPADAENCLALGADVSISGIVTFKNAEALRDAARLVPLSRLHVETDSPFLAPVPFRGKTNEPAMVAAVGAFLAELRGEDLDELRDATSANSARLFALAGRSA
jgi:TatD DNase family protein